MSCPTNKHERNNDPTRIDLPCKKWERFLECSAIRKWLVLVASCTLVQGAHAAEALVAVAANFSAPMKIIAQRFERETGHRIRMSFGSTGQFYAQIKNGAPFAILLAADAHTPTTIEREGLGVASSRFTYAYGKLVLWSKKTGLVDGNGAVLSSGALDNIAIANPKLAPYGAAAVEVIDRLGLADKLASKIVEGTSVSQAYQFVVSGNASMGFVALSQVYENGQIKEGSAWIVPSDLYEPIKQDAIILNAGRGNLAADSLMKFLRGDQARSVMRSFGYEH